MKRILTAIFIVFSVNVFALHPISERDSSFQNSINFSANYFFSSDAITNRFALAYFNNEYIDNDKKDVVSKKLHSLNRLGIGLNSELKYTGLHKTIFGLSNSFYSVSLGNHYHINSIFRKDAFELYFRGNSAYRGKTAELGEFVYNQIIYQNLKFTFGHTFSKGENNFGYTFGLGLNKGQKLYKILSEKADLYSEDIGRHLDLDADIKIYQSDSSKKELPHWNGTGGSVDFSIYRMDKNNNTLKIAAENFGFIKWNDKTAFVNADTSFRYSGIDVSDLFLFSDSIRETISLDSSLVEPYLSVREKKSYNTPLPARLSLSYLYILTPGKMDIEARVDYLFFARSTLHESIAFSYNFNSIHRLSLITSYGGYSTFQAGLAYTARFSKGWIFTLQSDYLSSMINPGNGLAQGAFVSLTAYF